MFFHPVFVPGFIDTARRTVFWSDRKIHKQYCKEIDSYVEISEKFCPTCKNINDRKASACEHCGSPFEEKASAPILTTRLEEIPRVPTAGLTGLYMDDSLLPKEGIALFTEGMTQPACLTFEGELVLGRDGVDADGASDENILNLSALGGYLMGISRRHAVIRRTDDGYEIVDLASTNGSWVNGMKLIPNRAYPLANGSKLRFGRMRLLILYREVSESKAAD